MKSKLYTSIKSALLLVAFCFSTFCSYAQNEGDIYDLDLDELMQLSTKRTSVLGLPHMQNKGEFQLKYSFANMRMNKTYDGTNEVDFTSILIANPIDPFAINIAPKSLVVNSHKFSGLYSFSDKLAIRLEGGFRFYDLRSAIKYSTLLRLAGVNNPGLWASADATGFLGEFSLSSSGFTDTELSAYYNIHNKGEHSLLANVGIMMPTGSIREGFKPPVQDTVLRAPYILQFGSGTFDPKISFTYLNSGHIWSTGIDVGTTLRLYDNNANSDVPDSLIVNRFPYLRDSVKYGGYRLGNEYWISAGTAYNLDKLITISLRFDFKKWEEIKGADHLIGAFESLWPIAKTSVSGGTRLNGSVGVSIDMPKGALKGAKLTLDFRTPLYQDLNGPQLNESSRMIFTLSKVFGTKHLD